VWDHRRHKPLRVVQCGDMQFVHMCTCVLCAYDDKDGCVAAAARPAFACRDELYVACCVYVDWAHDPIENNY
jgi:hypothetical protein